MENQQELTKENIQREFNIRQIRSKLIVFTKALMANFEATWFHKKYFNALDDFAHGRIKKLMIFVPPQHGSQKALQDACQPIY